MAMKQWIQLLQGHTLCIVPEEKRLNPEALASYIKDTKIDVLDCTPSQFKLVLASGKLNGPGTTPQAVLMGGEAVDEPVWAALRSNTQISYYNVYGPTECTVDVTLAHVQDASQPVIGRPLNNVQTYVLDTQFRPVPIGVEGELYVG